jgi:hypothetical protein
MKKVKTRKGFVIAECNEGSYKYNVFTKEEWSYGAGYRWAEWECDDMQEAIDFIDSY